MDHKMIFQKIGGSYQYVIDSPECLKYLLELKNAHWAALNVPRDSLNANAKFLDYLDPDADGMIRADEVKAAVKWLLETIADPEYLEENTDSVRLSELNQATDNGKAMTEFAVSHLADITIDEKLSLSSIQEKLNTLLAGPIKGDGIIVPDAATDTPAAQLITDIITVAEGVKNAAGAIGVNADLLNKFLADTKNYIDWEQTTEKPVITSKDAGMVFDAYSALKVKIDEYFSYCQMLVVDPGNATRFEQDPEKMTAINLCDIQAVNQYLKSAPLSKPDASQKLALKQDINPAWQQEANTFAEAFEVDELSVDAWGQIKKQLAPYEEYQTKAQGDKTGSLGLEKLNQYLEENNEAVAALQSLLAQDGALNADINCIKSFEKLILFRLYIISFLNNYVSFKELFVPARESMIQAGSLIMDGHNYDLVLKIKNWQEHKKLNSKSNVCTLYLELKKKSNEQQVMYAAVAVTAGNLAHIYIGKPAVFEDYEGNLWNAAIIDIIPAPISFWQTVFLPFRKFGESISSKFQKLSSFDTMEKNLEKSVKTAESDKAKSGLTVGSIAMLCGGVGIAAIGSSVAFIIRSLEQVHWAKILAALFGIILLILMPAIINALQKLRKRSLARFLEAAGWAVNLPLKLKSNTSNLFTYEPLYPANSRFKPFPSLSCQISRSKKALILLLTAAILYFTAVLIIVIAKHYTLLIK
jgi:hypothetical protein